MKSNQRADEIAHEARSFGERLIGRELPREGSSRALRFFDIGTTAQIEGESPPQFLECGEDIAPSARD